MSKLAELAALAAADWMAAHEYWDYASVHDAGEVEFFGLFPEGEPDHCVEFATAFDEAVQARRRAEDQACHELVMADGPDAADQELIDDFNHDDAKGDWR